MLQPSCYRAGICGDQGGAVLDRVDRGDVVRSLAGVLFSPRASDHGPGGATSSSHPAAFRSRLGFIRADFPHLAHHCLSRALIPSRHRSQKAQPCPPRQGISARRSDRGARRARCREYQRKPWTIGWRRTPRLYPPVTFKKRSVIRGARRRGKHALARLGSCCLVPGRSPRAA
jgi:hypothetical protein